jgi:hypothetical protein
MGKGDGAGDAALWRETDPLPPHPNSYQKDVIRCNSRESACYYDIIISKNVQSFFA